MWSPLKMGKCRLLDLYGSYFLGEFMKPLIVMTFTIVYWEGELMWNGSPLRSIPHVKRKNAK